MDILYLLEFVMVIGFIIIYIGLFVYVVIWSIKKLIEKLRKRENL